MASRLAYAGAFAAALLAGPAAAKQWGMVVGIDDYAAFGAFPPPPGELSDLMGAGNDARVISEAMRGVGVDLPDNRLLLDDKATLANFLAGWRELTAKAAPGDTLIVTFSGHGGQEREISEPFDEVTDQRDETIMFHDFDPENPRRGRLNDDQLYQLLKEASQFNVIWVMDSCHSAGLTRNINAEATGISRNGGLWDVPIEPLTEEIVAEEGDDEIGDLPHVTQVLATSSEDRLVFETTFEGRQHGALSWFFAQAMKGEADLDNNGLVTRAELSGYLGDRVFTHMNQNQQPRILPRGDASVALELTASDQPAGPAPPKKSRAERIREEIRRPVLVKTIGPPPALDGLAVRQVQTGAELTFEAKQGGGWTAYNHTGDKITEIFGAPGKLVARAAFLRALSLFPDPAIAPVAIEPAQPVDIQHIGEIVGFTFSHEDPELAYATLFNVASDGTLQHLFPDPITQDSRVGSRGLPVRFRVTEPTGADQLVAVFCNRPPIELHRLLSEANGRTVPLPDTLFLATTGVRCQVGRIGLFTAP